MPARTALTGTRWGRRLPRWTHPLRQLLFVLAAAASAADIVAGIGHELKPILVPNLGEYVLETGDELFLRCQHAFPVYWNYPMIEEPVTVSENTSYNAAEHDRPYFIHLRMTNLTYLQTGYFRCVDNRTSDLQDGSKVASTYVYVKGVGNSQLLAVDPNVPPLVHSAGERVTVPCRPTSPDVTVTLTKDNDEVAASKFDPRIGFTYFEKNTYEEEVSCDAKRGSEEYSYSFNIIPSPSSDGDVAVPLIQAPVHAIIGSTLELTCSVGYEPAYHIDLWWNVPDQAGISSKRIDQSPLKKVVWSHGQEEVAMRTLLVKRVLDIDEGWYNCTSQNYKGYQKVERHYISVLQPTDSYINLTSQGNITNISVPVDHDYVQWVLDYSAHPQPEFIWYGPGDKKIKPDGNHYFMQVNNLTVLLKIMKPALEDTGAYKLEAFNKGTKKSIDLFLNIEGRPELKVTLERYYMFNSVAEIVCDVLANPLPEEISWYFRPCEFQALENCEIGSEHRLNVNATESFELSVPKGNSHFESRLKLRATQSGKLQARACNSKGCDWKEVDFFVTDVPNGFSLDGPDEIVEGSQARFICHASAYFFSPEINWNFNNIPINPNDDFQVSKNSTKFSHVSHLIIQNVKKSNQGTYTCKTEANDQTYSNQSITLTVKDVRKPGFENGTNLHGNTVELNEKFSYVLVCNVSGVPRPEIKWLKDGKPFKQGRLNHISEGGIKIDFTYLEMEDAGKYTCVASNSGGTIQRSVTLSLIGKPKGMSIGLIIGLLLLGLLLVVVIVYLFVRVRREQKLLRELTAAGLANFKDGAIDSIDPNLGVEDQAELLPYDPSFEFPREKLKLGKTLGSGAFGVVVKAEAYGIIDREPVTPVAVKMVKRSGDSTIIKALASELKIMVHLGKHLNVVNLLGACTKGLNKMELLVIVEYCRYGNLHNYLMRHRSKFIDQIDPATGLIDATRGAEAMGSLPNGRNRLNYAALSLSYSGHSDAFKGDQQISDSRADYRSQSDTSENFATGATEATFVCMTPTGEEGFLMSNNSTQQPDWRSNYKGDYKGSVNPVTTRDLLCYAFQVARGMEYLASRKVLHGDLAARNILLAENNVIKICDFGLAKSVYKDENYLKKENSPLPIKWMAIESIRDRIFSTQSDVWSYGIVLWEFFTLAKTPYTGMPANEQLYIKLEEGYRMEKPLYATDDLYTLMMHCWEARPILRPSFTELVESLGAMLDDSVRKHYVDLNEPYVQMNDRWHTEAGRSDYLAMLHAPTYSNVVSPLPDEDDEPQRYMNIPHGAPTIVAESNIPGYLTMKSPSPTEPDSIFSPTRLGNNGATVFKFHTPPQGRRQLRDKEVDDNIELRPMLSRASRKSDSTSGHESDSDALSQYTAVPSSRPVIPNVDSRDSPLKPINQSKLPSFSNPSYSFAPDLVTSLDNYVNYPNQRNFNIQKPPELISSMPPPTFSTFGRKPAQDVKLPANYANVPAQRAPLALNEADFNDPPYVN